MGKVAKQRLEAKKRLLFASNGDDRSPEERAQARAMLDALQKKLEDDALREDGFFFRDGAFIAARRPRTTPGMKARSFDGHTTSVKALALVWVSEADSSTRQLVVTFGLDCVAIWDFSSSKQLTALDIASCNARFICGAAIAIRTTSARSGDASIAPVSSAARTQVFVAYVTHATPAVHVFDPHTTTISSAHDAAVRQRGYCAMHQQQITSMTFSPDAQTLATCSWDSTCMLWHITFAATDTVAGSVADTVDTEPLQAPLSLVLQQIFPVHDLGASAACFTRDGRQLVTTGDCTIKLWDVVSPPLVAPTVNTMMIDDNEGYTSLLLEHERMAWDAAIPYSLSVDASMKLLAFDDSLAALVPHHAWRDAHRAQPNGERALTLTMPLDPLQAVCPIANNESPVNNKQRAVARDTAPVQSGQSIEWDGDQQSGSYKDPSASDCDDQTPEHEATPLTCEHGVNSSSDGDVLPVEHAVLLAQYYRDLASFDFEQLLNPTLPYLAIATTAIGSAATTATNSDRSGDGDETHMDGDDANSSTAVSPLPLKPMAVEHLQWRSLLPDANSALCATFDDRDAHGRFCGHTSRITSVAVAAARDVVVTVSLDQTLKFWSLSMTRVCETVNDAHAAPIACCAVSTATTQQNPSASGMLVATGGRDNVVKVWRYDSLRPSSTECIYTLLGHNDAITACAFDPTGVFLVTSSDDTHVIVWRVVPASPDVPASPTVAAVDAFTITLLWTAPLANGAALLHYVIRCTQVSSISDDRQAQRELVVPAKTTTTCIDSLQPGTAYTFAVAAVNAIGASSFSAATARVETLAFVPSRIEPAVQTSDCAATHVRLSWRQPSPNGAQLLTVTIRCLPENSTVVPVLERSVPVAALTSVASQHQVATRSKAAADTKSKRPVKRVAATSETSTAPPTDAVVSYVVDGLWPGEIYQFVVAAANRCGCGTFSRVSDYVRMDATAPDAPAAPRIVDVATRQVAITWDAPKANGSAIVQYTLEWVQSDAAIAIIEDEAQLTLQPSPRTCNTVVLLTRSIAGTSYLLTDLAPGQPLCVWLAASNVINSKVCISARSPPSNVATTLCDVPDTPARPNLLLPASPASSGAHTLVLAFVPPKANGLAIERYDVLLFVEEVQFGITRRYVAREFAVRPDELKAIDNSAAGTMSVLVDKLRGKTYYCVQLSARNALGASDLSDCSALVTTKPPSVPARLSTPPLVVSDVEPTKTRIAWSLPEHDGGAPLTAFYVQYSMQPTSTVLIDDDDDVDAAMAGAARRYKPQFEHEVTVHDSCTLLATFLKPKTTYRFRVASANAVGRAPFSKKSVMVHTPSLVDFTIAQYFATRPPAEHVSAQYIQALSRVEARGRAAST